MKYIMIKTTSGIANMERTIPIIFPNQFVHANMYDSIQRQLIKQRGVKEVEIVSAGFINSLDLGAKCHGKSETLGVESREERDDAIIAMMDYTHGLVD